MQLESREVLNGKKKVLHYTVFPKKTAGISELRGRKGVPMYHHQTVQLNASTGALLHCCAYLFLPLRGGGGGGMGARRRRGGGGGFQKWASVPGPLFCVRTDVATKGAGTQILARKIFFTKQFSPTYV